MPVRSAGGQRRHLVVRTRRQRGRRLIVSVLPLFAQLVVNRTRNAGENSREPSRGDRLSTAFRLSEDGTMTSTRRFFSRIACLIIASAALTGCSSGGSSGCPAMASYSTPSSAVASADAVAVVHDLSRTGSTEVSGVKADLWSADVKQWEKGSGPEALTIHVGFDTCGVPGQKYVFEDLEGEESVYVFLMESGDQWWALNSFQGAVRAKPDGGFPDQW